VPLPRKFMNFSSQNGVISCILGVLFLRFICPMDCSCMINFIEVPVCTYRTIGIQTGKSMSPQTSISRCEWRTVCAKTGFMVRVSRASVRVLGYWGLGIWLGA